MTYSKYNLVYRLQKWMDTVAGQTFLNYAYSWGASVVILGALFKLTHLPGANIMLFIGMGTEVFVFFISAFDRPFDKTAEGRIMPTHLTEEYLETGKVNYPVGEDKTEEAEADASIATHRSKEQPQYQPQPQYQSQPQYAASEQSQASVQTPASVQSSESVQSPVSTQQSAPASTPNFVPQMSKEEAEAMNEAQGNYVEELKTLVETLKKVNEQSSRLTRDSEEMENLNRTLTGISKIYEMQLKGASKQIGTIDEINAQTKKMAEQIDQLNHIYARMIEAMTVNMRAAAPNAGMTKDND
jgi:gliding motility-associated protein GldL